MIKRLPMLSVFFCIMIGVVQGSRTSLRGKDEPSSTNRKNIVTMDDVDAELERLFANNEQGNARKLDNTCWHGGQAGDDLTWLGRNWGSCKDMDPCFCGMHPLRMAYLCPDLCRPSCGGSCATPAACPIGFNIENGQVVPYTGTIDVVVYPPYWPPSYGPMCQWYPNPGAPAASPPLTPPPTPASTPAPTPAPTPSPTPPGNGSNADCFIPPMFGGC